MKELRRNLEMASDMQNKKIKFQEESSSSEVTIKMSRSTLFFIVLMQIFIVSLFFVLGFIVAWNYNTQVTPAAFAKTMPAHNTQIMQDIMRSK